MSDKTPIDIIRDNISCEPYMLSDETKGQGHFMHGDQLHSDRYFLVKNYLQSTGNCEGIVDVLKAKIDEIKNQENKTEKYILVGFKNYTGLLLRMVTGYDAEYALLEQKGNQFDWLRELPKGENLNLIIVLPVSCTCTTYIRIKEWIEKWIESIKKEKKEEKEQQINITVSKNFINVFHTVDESIESINGRYEWIEMNNSPLYSSFNWKKIIKEKNNGTYKIDLGDEIIAHSLVCLFADLQFPEQCEYCFPANLKDERIVFQLNNDFETPNLLHKLPELVDKEPDTKPKFSDVFLKENKNDIKEKKGEPDTNPLLYGHYKVGGRSYQTYVQGKIFYKQNEDDIYNEFEKELNGLLKIQAIKKIGNNLYYSNKTELIEKIKERLKRNYIIARKKEYKKKWEEVRKNKQDYKDKIDGAKSANEREEFEEDAFYRFCMEILEEELNNVNKDKGVSQGDEEKQKQEKLSELKNEIAEYNIENIDKRSVEELMKLFYTRKIVFVASGTKHRSSFLEDFCARYNQESNHKIAFHILKYDVRYEFIDGFMSNNRAILRDDEDYTLKIFYEDVLSSARTFKLLSNYIKHYNKTSNKDKRHGFDYIFSLIDRTTKHKRNELLKKLTSDKNEEVGKHLISFFRLYVPIVAAPHLVNPLVARENEYRKMIASSHLDALKRKTIEVLKEKMGKDISKENEQKENSKAGSYFPFEEDNGSINDDTFRLYEHITPKNYELLKLYASHEINKYISDGNQAPNIKKIYKLIYKNIEVHKESFFIKDENRANRTGREMVKERKIVKEEILKTLTRPPFVYSARISHATFNFCLCEIEKILNRIIEKKALDFNQFRDLKFYMRRLIDLDSSFLVSEKMLKVLQCLFEKPKLTDEDTELIDEKLKNPLDKLKDKIAFIKPEFPINENGGNEQESCQWNNCEYKIKQIDDFASFVISCYKESFYKNHYRSVKLEGLINNKKFLPELYQNDVKDKEKNLNALIRDPYYTLTGMIKAENVYFLNNLKKLVEKNQEKFLNKIDDVQKKIIKIKALIPSKHL